MVKNTQKNQFMKTVLYLIQAAAGLPRIYSCLRKRNFLILSYKEETADTAIFAPKSTWSVGRNLLRDYVIQRNLRYDYYVYLDEDIIFMSNSRITHFLMTYLRVRTQTLTLPKYFVVLQEAGFNSLEDSLNLEFPILTMLGLRGIGQSFLNTLTYLSKKLFTDACTQNYKKWDVQTIPSFDAMLSAFSMEVFWGNTILPYEEKYDTVSIWYSQIILCTKANYYYPQQIIRNNCYRMHNSQKGEYNKHQVVDYNKVSKDLYSEVCRELGVKNIQFSREVQIEYTLPPVKNNGWSKQFWGLYRIIFHKNYLLYRISFIEDIWRRLLRKTKIISRKSH